MVLQNYSWQDFALAALALLVLWYLGLWLFYRWRSPDGTGPKAEPLPHSWQDQVEVLADQDQVMGSVKLDRGESVVSADDFRFAEGNQSPDKAEKLGLIPDLQQEIKSICSLLAENDGTKEDFFSMFGVLVKDAYPEIPEGYREALNAYIREHVPFYLSTEELESLWS